MNSLYFAITSSINLKKKANVLVEVNRLIEIENKNQRRKIKKKLLKRLATNSHFTYSCWEKIIDQFIENKRTLNKITNVLNSNTTPSGELQNKTLPTSIQEPVVTSSNTEVVDMDISDDDMELSNEDSNNDGNNSNCSELVHASCSNSSNSMQSNTNKKVVPSEKLKKENDDKNINSFLHSENSKADFSYDESISNDSLYVHPPDSDSETCSRDSTFRYLKYTQINKDEKVLSSEELKKDNDNDNLNYFLQSENSKANFSYDESILNDSLYVHPPDSDSETWSRDSTFRYLKYTQINKDEKVVVSSEELKKDRDNDNLNYFLQFENSNEDHSNHRTISNDSEYANPRGFNSNMWFSDSNSQDILCTKIEDEKVAVSSDELKIDSGNDNVKSENCSDTPKTAIKIKDEKVVVSSEEMKIDSGNDNVKSQNFSDTSKTNDSESSKLIVSNLHCRVNDSDLDILFSDSGPIKKVNVMYDAIGYSKGWAEIIFEKRADAITAMNKYNGRRLDGRELNIELYSESDSKY